MAEEMLTLENHLGMAVHHVGAHKVRLMLAGGASPEDFEYRFKLVREKVGAAILQIRKIREAAQRTGCKEVLTLLDEETIPTDPEKAIGDMLASLRPTS